MTRNEDRMRFHTMTSLDNMNVNSAFLEFKKFVGSLLPKDKYSIFLSLLKFPIDTVRLTDETYQALEKVFDGRNPVMQYDFLEEETKNDWLAYQEEVLKSSTFWKTKGFEVMKKAIHSFMVVDLPTEQVTERPEPYMFFLDIRNVIDFMEVDGKLEWIMFEMSDDRIGVYDDLYYRVFSKKVWDGGMDLITPMIESTHDLGYCPAKSFWTGLSPISTQLAQLDWILFFSVSKKFSDLYSPYTIYWGYKQDCDFDDKHTGHHCDGGFLRNRDDQYLYNHSRELIGCPKCSDKISGVGTFVDVPPPVEDVPLMAPPVGKVDVDVESLNYNVKELERLESNFYTSVTGNSLEVIDNQAVNEKQVISLFESRKQVLINLKKNFEDAQSWTERTICQLRYGNSFLNLSINYGTEFYLFTPEVIFDMYVKAREANMDHMTLDMLQREAYETKYRNNPIELARINILLNIDPFRHLTNEQVSGLSSNEGVDNAEIMMKLNMSSLIMRFERENGSIVDFGSAISFSSKIDSIRKTLKSYISPEPIPVE